MSMEDNQPVANVVVEERRSVPSRSELSLRVIVHDENRQRLRNQTGIVKGSVVFDELTEMSPIRNVVVTTDDDGLATVTVLNLTEYPISVNAGTYYGEFQAVEVLEHIEDATALMNAIIFDSQPAERPSSLTINKLEATSSDPANLKEVIEAFKLESEELGGNAAGDIMTSSTLSVLSEESDPDTFLIKKASSETSSPSPQPSSSPWYTSLLTIDDPQCRRVRRTYPQIRRRQRYPEANRGFPQRL